MKILFITDLYPIGEEKIARALFYFVEEWQRQGHQVEVIRANFITNTKLRGREIVEERIYKDLGTKIYNLNFHSPFLFDVRKKLPEEFSLKNYDVMISHMPCGALMAQKLLKKEKIKYICAVHASDIAVLTKPYYSVFFKNKLKEAYLTADKISARSPILKQKIEKLIPETKNKTFIAFSGIKESIIDKDIKPLNKKEIKLITVASLIKRKNVDKIIKTISLMKNESLSLTIVGSGKEKANLKKLTKHLNLRNKIIFKDEISREEVFDELKKSDIFILPSQNETFGLAYLEAMAKNNIVICRKNDGIDGVIENGKNAFLTDAKPENIKKTIEEIINMKEEEIITLKKEIKKTIQNYTNKIAAENYIKNIL